MLVAYYEGTLIFYHAKLTVANSGRRGGGSTDCTFPTQADQFHLNVGGGSRLGGQEVCLCQKYSSRNGSKITNFEEFRRETMPSVKKEGRGGEKLCPLNATVGGHSSSHFS